ncbi:DUF4231 domain-containing protein [Mesorhizobium sp. AR02]|uniref:DUF4231 domain-containing protein n=1 Tax=Mesorhizobium sp. AR02 TaxID=2865837 RepID=UPI00215DD944|nr:DUF4231 domain-containing protein [Mesorhizobium sp. AR02]UVK50942.1 DUF4231 domain-containing protein [Mesorhizobium sp. AR02]
MTFGIINAISRCRSAGKGNIVMEPLASASVLQSTWSRTANRLKQTIDRTRWIALALSAVAALLAAVASQIQAPQPPAQDHLRLSLAVGSAVLLGVVSFLSARLLGGTQVAAWTRIRAASEALKREIYKYAASAAPYDDPAQAKVRFNAEQEEIANDIDDLIGLLEREEGPGSASTAPFQSPDEYVEKRVHSQIKWYNDGAATYGGLAKTLRWIEFTLSLVAAIVTAAVGVAGKTNFIGFSFDFVALTAVLTTIGGAILAHIEASRYDFLVATYRAAARRLGHELNQALSAFAMPSSDWSSFVERCETILSIENSSWIAKFGKT